MSNQEILEDVEHETEMFRNFLQTNYEFRNTVEYKELLASINKFLIHGQWTTLEDDRILLCNACNGSGEGMFDGTVCGVCRGKGSM